jgi:hypothetical protein
MPEAPKRHYAVRYDITWAPPFLADVDGGAELGAELGGLV